MPAIRVPRLFIAGIAVGFAVGIVAAGFVGGGGEPPAAGGGRGPGGGFSPGAMTPAVTTALVAQSSVGRTIDAVGAGRAAKSVTLVSEATGLVEQVAIRPGEAVAAGDLLLKIDDAEQRIALARAKARYPVAKANNERFAALYKEDSASKLEADAAFNDYKAAEAELRAAEFALGQRTMRAPFDGVVGLTSIEAGDYVRAGDVVTTIDDLSALIIEFTAPQETATHIRLGQAVEASLAGGDTRIAGVVSGIDSRVDPTSRTLKIEATFADAPHALLPGATYAVTTTSDGAPALSVPGLAVQWDRTGAYVWKLSSEGEASRASITILQRRDDIAIVDGDIEAGARIVVEGADRVRPGMAFPQAGARVGAGATGAAAAGGAK